MSSGHETATPSVNTILNDHFHRELLKLQHEIDFNREKKMLKINSVSMTLDTISDHARFRKHTYRYSKLQMLQE